MPLPLNTAILGLYSLIFSTSFLAPGTQSIMNDALLMTVSSGWYQLIWVSRELVSWLWCQQGESSCSLSNLVSRNSLTQLNTAWMTRYRGDTGSACSARSSVCFTSFEGSNKQELRVCSVVMWSSWPSYQSLPSSISCLDSSWLARVVLSTMLVKPIP